MEKRKMKGRENKLQSRAPFIICLITVLFLAFFFAVFHLRPSRQGEPLSPEVSAPKAESSPDTFSRLEINTVSCDNGQIRIEGITNLPDGGKLIVDLDAASPESESDTAVSEHATVKEGRYSVTITPPHTPAFVRGPYTVTVLFSPRVQPKNVLALVGRDGENLTGNLAHETFGFRVLETTERVKLSLNTGAIWRRGESRN
jgi:hypothetical protein